MALEITYTPDGNYTKCEIKLTNGDNGNYIAGSYIVITDVNNTLLNGITFDNYDPTKDVIVLLIIEEHSSFSNANSLEFTIRAKVCPSSTSDCKNIYGVPYIYAPNGTGGPKKGKRSHPVASNELGGG